MTSVLVMGFVPGMRHALEADRVAAVASLAIRSLTTAHALRQRIVWGLGHTLTLMHGMAGSAALILLALGRIAPPGRA